MVGIIHSIFHKKSKDISDTNKQGISSEYGSAEPSPTHLSSRVIFHENDSDGTDCDSDSESENEATMAEFYERKYQMLIKDLRKEVKRSRKEAGFYYKFYKEYDKILHKYELLKREVYYLRHKLAQQAEREQYSLKSCKMPRALVGAPDQLCSMNDLNNTNGSFDVSKDDSFLAMDEMDEVKIFPKNSEEFELARGDDNASLDKYMTEASEIPVRDEGYSTWENKEVSMQTSLSDSELYKPGIAEKYSDMEEQPIPMKKTRKFRYKLSEDNGAGGTSEEETIHVLARQLKKKGQCVHYKGKRKDIISDGNRLFKRFGNKERDAIKQFDYLQNMSSDISGFITTPQQSPQYQ